MTFQATRNAISSPVAVSGPSQLDLLDGLTTAPYGLDRARANRSRRPAKGSEPMIQGICGRTFIASSVPAGPLSSWESRLRARLATVGSTESALIWREKVTPAGQPISRLAVSTRHTNGTGSTGSPWSTPRASDGEKGGPSMCFGAGGQPLPAQMHQAHWTTVSAEDSAARENRYAQGGNPLTMQMNKAMWPVMLASDVQKQSENPETGRRRRGKGQQIGLNTFIAMEAAFHPTPLSLSFKDSHQPGTNRTIEQMRAYMPTPTVIDATGRGYQRDRAGNVYPTVPGILKETEPTGPTPTGSNATTAKRGAPNPVFAFWLMGFPDEWISGALAAMRSFRKPRRKS